MFGFLGVLWIGLLLGVSFIATPVKFRAQSLTLPTALEVGRVTFAVFSRIEWALSAALLATGLWQITNGSINSPVLTISIGLMALLALQTFWIRPVLDHRVGELMSGGQPAPSSYHRVYVALEIIKLVLLAAVVAQA